MRDYYHVISDTNDKLAYFDGETIVVSGIFGDEASEKKITMKNEFSDVASPIESCSFSDDSYSLSVTYLSGADLTEITGILICGNKRALQSIGGRSMKSFSWSAFACALIIKAFIALMGFFAIISKPAAIVSAAETERNFTEDYYPKIVEIAEKYDAEAGQASSTYGPYRGASYKGSVRIYMQDGSTIVVSFWNYYASIDYDPENGRESFQIVYESATDENGEVNFNNKLFRELVNEFSGRRISRFFLNGFFDPNNTKYATEVSEDGSRISKYHNLDFFEHWRIYYKKNSLGAQAEYWGYTKYKMKWYYRR